MLRNCSFFCVSTLTLSTCTIDPKNTDKKHPGYVWDLCTSKRTRFYLFSYSICCICWMVFKWNWGTLSLFLSIFFKGVFGSWYFLLVFYITMVVAWLLNVRRRESRMQQHYQPPAPSEGGATPVCAQIDTLTVLVNKLLLKMFSFLLRCLQQGGRTWQPFVGGKNGQANFRQANYNFRDKCIVFARNCKVANVIQYDMRYIAIK